jgi:hypothetical protein
MQGILDTEHWQVKGQLRSVAGALDKAGLMESPWSLGVLR